MLSVLGNFRALKATNLTLGSDYTFLEIACEIRIVTFIEDFAASNMRKNGLSSLKILSQISRYFHTF